jgi:hypothetical protein
VRFTVGSEYDLSMAVTSQGQFVDPLLVRLDIRDPDGLIVTYQTPDPAIVKDDQGRYHFTLAPTKPGRWLYKWSTQGGIMIARTREMYVEDVFVTL